MVAMLELLRSIFLHDHFSCSSFTGGLLTLDLSSRLPLLSVQLEGAPFLQLFHGSFFNFYCLFLNPALLRLTLIRWHYLDFLNWLYSMSRSAAFRLAFQHRSYHQVVNKNSNVHNNNSRFWVPCYNRDPWTLNFLISLSTPVDRFIGSWKNIVDSYRPIVCYPYRLLSTE